MGTTLEETLAEFAAEDQQAQNTPPPPYAPPKAAGNVVLQPAPQPSLKKGLLATAGDAIKKTTGDIAAAYKKDGYVGFKQKTDDAIGAGLVRAPGQLLGGIVDTAADIGRFMGTNIDAGQVRSSGSAALDSMAIAGQVMQQGLKKAGWGASLADVLSMKDHQIAKVGYPGLNQFTTEAVASTAPMLVPGGGLVAGAAKAAVGGAVGMAAETPQQRLANAALGAGAEVGLSLLGKAAGAMLPRKTVSTGTPVEAAHDALSRDFATNRTTAVRNAKAEADLSGKPLEPDPQEAVATPSRHSDTPSPTGEPKDPHAALAEDANKALELSGAAERVDPVAPKISPEGKVIVGQAAKDAADEAGYGRAFAADNEAPRDSVIFKEEASDGSSRVVGSMARDDLAGLSETVQHFRDNPDAINLPADSPHGQWKMANLGAPYDAAAMLRGVVESIDGKGPKLSDAEAMDVAQKYVDFLPAEERLGFVQSLSGDTPGDARVAAIAARTIWKRLSDDASALVGRNWMTASEDEFVEATQRFHQLQMFSMAMREAKGEAGDGLRAWGLPDSDSFKGAVRAADRDPARAPPKTTPDNPPPIPRTREELQNMVEMWDALKGDPQKQADFLTGIRQYPPGQFYLRNSVASFFTASILSGLKTIALNFVGPAVMSGVRASGRMVGGVVAGTIGPEVQTLAHMMSRTSGAMGDAANPLVSTVSRAQAWAVVRDTPMAYFGAMADMGDAFKYAWEAAKTGDSTLGGASPIDVRTGGLNVSEPLIRAAQADGKSSIPYYLGNVINLWPKVMWRIHGSTNEFSLALAYSGEVRASAYMEIAEKGLKGQEANDLLRQRLHESVDNASGKATDADSFDKAERAMMTRPTDPVYNKGAASAVKVANAMRQAVPETRYILPVLQVPANALGESIRMIPGVNLALRETRAELSGSLGVMRQADAFGRMALGGTFLVAGGVMARQGMMTGAGPQDARDRAIWLQTHQPYSIRVGGQWVGYNQMDPIGPLLAMTASYFDDSVYKGTDQDTTLAAVGALAQYFKDKAAIQGISDLFNFGGDPRDQATLLRRAGGTAKGFIVPAFMNTVRVAADHDLRVKRGLWDYVIDGIPYASKTLDPVRNIFGEDVMKPQGSAVETILPVTLTPQNNYDKAPVLDEIRRLYERTGYTPGALQPSFGGQSKFDMRDAKLENGRSLYDALLQQRQFTEIDGRTLKDALKEAIDSPEYAEAVDGTGRIRDEDDIPYDTRGGMVQRIFSDYSKQAKQDVAKASPVAARWMAAAQYKTLHNDTMRGTPLPDLMKSLNLDLSGYEAAAKGE